MTRPRAEQFKDLTTVHKPVGFSLDNLRSGATAGVQAATIIPLTITGVIGGLDSGTSAEIIGTASRLSAAAGFGLGSGDSLTIKIDGTQYVINFAATDSTIYDIVNKINAVTGPDVVASPTFDGQLGTNGPVPVGRLRLKSPTTGSGSSVEIVSGTGTTLTKLGLTVGVTTGVSAPVRGVITNGGYTSIKFSNNRDFTSNNGDPLFARLFHQSSSGQFLFKMLSRGPTSAILRSASADYTPSILNGESFTLHVFSFNPATVTFGPADVNQLAVVNTINNAFYTANPGVSGYAIVTGSRLSPFSFSASGEDLVLTVNGTGPSNIELNDTHITAADVAAQINLTFPSLANGPGGRLVLNTSGVDPNKTGVQSEIIIGSSTSQNVLQQLGLIVGVYKPLTVARRSSSFGSSASNEIKLVSPTRGLGSSIAIASPTDCLKKLGFCPSGDSSNGLVVGDEELQFGPDDLNLLPTRPPAFPSLKLSVPEVVEFHEIPIENNTNARKFDDSNPSGVSISSGLIDAGKVLLLNTLGQIDDSFLRNAIDSNNILNKITRVISATDIRLVTRGIETGGTLGNTQATSNVMEFDIDPNNTLPAGSWIWRAHRDAASVVVANLIEADSSLIGNPPSFKIINGVFTTSGTLRFSDANILASTPASNDTAALSDPANGAKFLRFAERGPANATPQQTVSIFKSLNARYTITVGDGVNTFGDFNGTDAIKKAVDFIQNTLNFPSGPGVKIQVKRGTYDIGSSIVLSSNLFIEIEGMTPKDTIINNLTDISPAFAVNNNSHLIARNILFRGPGTNTAADIQVNSGSLRLENCKLTNQSIQINNGTNSNKNHNVFLAKDCEFTLTNRILPMFEIRCNDGLAHHGYVFEDCNMRISTTASDLATSDSIPILKITCPDISNATRLSGVHFNRCDIKLGSTTSNGANNLVGNCGVLEIVPTGNNLLQINDITWTDCRVRANNTESATIGGSPATSLLLYLRTANTSSTKVGFNRITIRGGYWTCPQINTVFTPFYIGSFHFDDTSASVDSVVIEDVLFGFTNSNILVQSPTAYNHGKPTTELSPPSTSDWAAYFIHARTIKMHNVQFVGHVRSSDSGDLYIFQPQRIDVNNVQIKSYYNGGLSVPNFRVKIEGSTVSSGTVLPTDGAAYRGSEGEVNGLILEGFSTLSPWVNTGLVLLIPNGRLWLEKCVIHDFGITGLGGYGFVVPTASPGDNLRKLFGLTLSNCSVFRCKGGFGYNHGAAVNEPAIRALKIIGCNFQENEREGILITGATSPSAAPFKSIIISNNIIRLNGTTTNRPGIVIQPGTWLGNSPEEAIVLMGNTCVNNNATVAAVQILIGQALIQFPKASAFGNNCNYNGLIKILPMDSVTFLRGFEVGYDTSGLTAVKLFTTGQSMLHNAATLENT